MQIYKHSKRSGTGSWRLACAFFSEDMEDPSASTDSSMVPARLELKGDDGDIIHKDILVCAREPSFGCKEEGIKRRCAVHALPTDTAVNQRTCEADKCERRALYGDPSERIPKRCGGHMHDSDELMVGPKCAMPGCQRGAYFGDGVSPQLYCKTHKSPEHVQLRGADPELKKKRMECIVPGCAERAIFGPYDGIKSTAESRPQSRKVVRCRKHKLPDDLSAATLTLLATGRFCQHVSGDVPPPSQFIPGLDPSRCRAAANYGDPNDGVPKFCGKHKPAGYVNVTPLARRRRPILHRHLIQLFDGPSFDGLVDESEFGISTGSNRSEDYSSTFTYIIVCAESRECIVIDPVLEQVERDAAIIELMGLSPVYAVNTHVHADHITGTAELRARFPDMQTAISHASGAKADIRLEPHQSLFWGTKNKGALQGNRELRCLPTPGHTAGCMSFYDPSMNVGGSVFTGDALLIGGCGRTDFQGGDASMLYRSIHKEIFTLDKRATVYPAHDYAGKTHSTIGEEIESNPRLGSGMSEGDFVSLMDARKMPYPKRIDEAVPANMQCGEF
eukprot:g1065.t1